MNKIIIATAMLFGNFAFAQIPNFEMRMRNVEQKTYQLEQQNMQLQRRVWDLEQYIYHNPPPPTDTMYVCAFEHTSSFRVYMGKSRSKIEAEAIAKNACVSSTVSPQYCALYECSAEDVAGHTCRITHTVNKQDYLGRGKSLTEAKSSARNTCAASTARPQFCDVETLFCD